MTRSQTRSFSAGGTWHRWANFNLTRNPFGELSRQERAEAAVVDLEPIVTRIEASHTAVQLVGDRGRGKTTRLLALAQHFHDACYVSLPEDRPCPAIPDGSPLLIDEAQRLSRAALRAIFRHGLPTVLATHRDLTRTLERFGYQVFTERVGDRNDVELVWSLLNRRIEASRLEDGPVPVVSLKVASRLVQRFGDDIRSMEHFLYEQVQSQMVQHGEMRFVD